MGLILYGSPEKVSTSNSCQPCHDTHKNAKAIFDSEWAVIKTFSDFRMRRRHSGFTRQSPKKHSFSARLFVKEPPKLPGKNNKGVCFCYSHVCVPENLEHFAEFLRGLLQNEFSTYYWQTVLHWFCTLRWFQFPILFQFNSSQAMANEFEIRGNGCENVIALSRVKLTHCKRLKLIETGGNIQIQLLTN